jgi:SAM-dependent methyltransferase
MKRNSKLLALAGQMRGEPVAQARLAWDLAAAGQGAEAMQLAQSALAGCESDPETERQVAALFSSAIREPYLAYLQDEARVAAYDAAIRRAVRPGMRVLEIGSGTGLFAMMAARAGAEAVIACESNPLVAAMAGRVIARNGLSDRVRVLAASATELELDRDLGGRVEVIIGELLPRGLRRHAGGPIVANLARKFLQPGGRVIPARATMRIALVEDGSRRFRSAGDCAGFDMRAFGVAPTTAYSFGRYPGELVLRSAAHSLPAMDLHHGMLRGPGDGTLDLTCEGGTVDGIAQWFALDLDDAVRFENHPASSSAITWPVQIFPWRSPRQVPEGQAISVRYSLARGLDISIAPD